jgi:hypothetical protein
MTIANVSKFGHKQDWGSAQPCLVWKVGLVMFALMRNCPSANNEITNVLVGNMSAILGWTQLNHLKVLISQT